MRVRVAFQGEVGAYIESAIYAYFGPSVDVKPCRDLSDVFKSVEKGETEFGVVPHRKLYRRERKPNLRSFPNIRSQSVWRSNN